MLKYIVRTAFAVLIFFQTNSNLFADDNITPAADNYTIEDIFTLEDVEVRAKFREQNASGKTSITREYIHQLPAGNGNVTDILRFAPSV